MAYSTIPKPSVHFNTKLYTGNSSTQAITGVGFQPDWVWIKRRDASAGHKLTDAVRGVNKQLVTNNNNAQNSDTNVLTAFGSDGFTLGNSTDVNNNTSPNVAWNWKANGTGSSNTDGSRTTTVSVNTTAGFSIGTCASLATNNDTLGHGLGAVPKMIIVKNTQAGGSWWVYHASLGNTNRVYLNGTEASGSSTIWNNTTPTSSVFTIKGGDFATGESLVFYAFAEKTGYSKFGSYVGNGNADGTFVYTGFKPAWLMMKRKDAVNSWYIFDNKRNLFNVTNSRLKADDSVAESSNLDTVDFLSNGFKFRESNDAWNGSEAYIYMAFAEEPLVANSGTDGVPATAR